MNSGLAICLLIVLMKLDLGAAASQIDRVRRVVASSSGDTELNISDLCLLCLCQTSGECIDVNFKEPKVEDESSSNPYKLTLKYWIDAGLSATGFELGGFKKCSQVQSCSESVIGRYMKKFLKKDCNDDGKVDCLDVGLVHLASRKDCKGSSLRRTNQWEALDKCVGKVNPEDVFTLPDVFPTISSCSSNQFTCDDSKCIHHTYKCNGVKDCSDGSDEHLCEKNQVKVIGEANSKEILISNDEYPFSMAEQLCKSAGGVPLAITSKEEHDLVAFYLRTKGVKMAWLGATRGEMPHDAQGSNFYWVKNKVFINRNGGYTNWAEGEPSNYGDDENCVYMWKEYNYKWNDDNCDVVTRVLCEAAITA